MVPIIRCITNRNMLKDMAFATVTNNNHCDVTWATVSQVTSNSALCWTVCSGRPKWKISALLSLCWTVCSGRPKWKIKYLHYCRGFPHKGPSGAERVITSLCLPHGCGIDWHAPSPQNFMVYIQVGNICPGAHVVHVGFVHDDTSGKN